MDPGGAQLGLRLAWEPGQFQGFQTGRCGIVDPSEAPSHAQQGLTVDENVDLPELLQGLPHSCRDGAGGARTSRDRGASLAAAAASFWQPRSQTERGGQRACWPHLGGA